MGPAHGPGSSQPGVCLPQWVGQPNLISGLPCGLPVAQGCVVPINSAERGPTPRSLGTV